MSAYFENRWAGEELIYLSPSLLDSFADCPRKAGYHRLGIKTAIESSKFVFGRAGHETIELYLGGVIDSLEMPEVFKILFNQALDAGAVELSASETPEGMLAIGMALMKSYPDWWASQKIRPLMQECKLDFEFARGVRMRLRPDLIGEHECDVLDPFGRRIVKAGEVSVVDWKFVAPGSSSNAGFAVDSSQPSWYIIGSRLQGIPAVAAGYGNGLKKAVPKKATTVGPHWESIHLHRRAQFHLDAAVEFALHVVEQFRRGNFHRQPKLAFNSPCDGMVKCEYLDLCKYGNPHGLVLPKELKLCEVL